MNNNLKFSVVVAVRDEQDSLLELQKELNTAMAATASKYEIIYVDDASSDASHKILKDLQKSFPGIRIISFEQNAGQSAALVAGFRAARGEFIITLDADGQNPPKEIQKLIGFCEEYDCVTGIRINRKDDRVRKIASGVAHLFRKIILQDTTQDTGCSLRIFKRKIIDQLPFFKNFHRFFVFIIKTYGFSVIEVTVRHRQRTAGLTKYSNFKRLCEGLIDIWAMLWLKHRILRYKIKNEN